MSCCVSLIAFSVSTSCTPIQRPTRSRMDAGQARSNDASAERTGQRDDAVEERDPDDAGPAADSGR